MATWKKRFLAVPIESPDMTRRKDNVYCRKSMRQDYST